jgi:hypothetical protein
MPGIDANTILCCHCDGADGGAVFIDSAPTPHVLTASGNTVTAAAAAYFGGAGLSNGAVVAGAGVTSSSPTDFQPSGNFTVELWFNGNGSQAASNQYLVSLANGTAAGNIAFALYRVAASGLIGGLVGYGATTIEVDSLTAYADSAWHHLALVLTGAGSLSLFVDGVLQSSAAVVSVNEPSGSIFAIGNLVPGTDPSLPWPGFIDELRISNVARYLSNFAPPTGPFDNQQLFNPIPQLAPLLAS